MKNSKQHYFTVHSPFTDPGEYSFLYDDLPCDIERISKIVRGLLLHIADDSHYKYKIPDNRKAEIDSRYVSKILAKTFELDSSSLTNERSLENRVIAVCRDFPLVACSILRHMKIPCRLRFGFMKPLFRSRKYYLDYTVLEYWNAEQARWCVADVRAADIRFKCELRFNRYDLPSDIFIPAGLAWLKGRRNIIDPALFRYNDLKDTGGGFWCIRNLLMLDLMAINKQELLLWDCWGYIWDSKFDCPLDNKEELMIMDKIAELLQSSDFDQEQIKQFYLNSKLKVPKQFFSMSPVLGKYEVNLG